MNQEWQQGAYRISTDKSRLDFDMIYNYLSLRSYWAAGRAMDAIRDSVENSLTFGMYQGEQQIGMARVITDYATFAYLCDVFVLPEFRGQGLGKWLMKVVTEHPDLQRGWWLLATGDAHGLYEQVGFTPLPKPKRFMQKREI
jgi:GNAT superfamily N-acetyltransferase